MRLEGISGTYTTTRDGGLTYEYDGFWFVADDRLVWRSRIRRGSFKAMLHGDLPDASKISSPFAARDAIAKIIASRLESLVEK